jgi:hypothetical protein
VRILVCGGRNYGNIPKAKDGNGPDREHPDFPAREKEFNHVITELYRIAEARSKNFVPDDNWLPTDIEIISGMATGADAVAVDWAIVNWCHWHEYPAEWTDLSHPDAVIRTRRDGTQYDAKAGSRRNQRMLDEGHPNLVIAFPGGTGTADMVRRARKAGVEVIEISAAD